MRPEISSIFQPTSPHQPFNLSQTDWAEAIVARTDPNEQESVVPYEPGGDAGKPGKATP